MSYSTKLTSYDGYNVDKMMIFSKPEINSVPNSSPKISYQRIRIATKFPKKNESDDDVMGDLIVSTPPGLYSFGLQENRELGTGKVNGYVLPICLWNKDGASKEEKEFTDKFIEIVDRCKKHLIDHKDDIGKYELDMSDLKNFNPLFWKKDKGKVVEGAGPKLYIKVMMSKKTENMSIKTMFVNNDTKEEMRPSDIMDLRCYVKAAFKIESIYIGSKISLQLKLYEVLVKPVETERPLLLTPYVIRRQDDAVPLAEEEHQENMFDALASNVVPTTAETDSGSIDDDNESSSDEDDEEEEKVAPTPKTPSPPTRASTVEPVVPAAPKKATTTRKGGRQAKS